MSKLVDLRTYFKMYTFIVQLHQEKESKANEIAELSTLYHAAQREVSMQGSMIMNLQERLEQASQQFRLPSEAVVDDEKRRKTNKHITALTETIQDLTERLDCSVRSRAAVDVQLQLCREENTQLRDQLQELLQFQQGRPNIPDRLVTNSSTVGVSGSPALNRTSGRKAVPFGTFHIPDHSGKTSNTHPLYILQKHNC